MSVKYINHDELRRSLMLCREAKVPVCIIGGVGCGKTTAVEDLVKDIRESTDHEFHLWKIFLGMVDNTDIGGIPVRTDDNEIIYAPPKFLPFGCKDSGIILGDEYDRSAPEVQNAFNQILLGGEIHGNKISPNAFVVLTMNGTSDRYTTQLSEAARNRVCTLFLSSKAASSLDQWDRWARKNGINDVIRGFARFQSNLIESHEDFDEQAIITPRSRDMAGRILDAADKVSFKTDDIMHAVLAGIIGQNAAMSLIAFEREREKLPDIDDMLKTPGKYETHACWEEASLCYAVGIAVSSRINEEDLEKAENAITLVSYMPDEVGAWAVRNISDACPQVCITDKYREYFDEIKEMI